MQTSLFVFKLGSPCPFFYHYNHNTTSATLILNYKLVNKIKQNEIKYSHSM